MPTGRAVAWRTSPGVVYWETPRVLELTNSGALAFPYVLESNVPWLSFSGAANGVVLGGQRARIELAIDANACPTAGGEHIAVVSVLNAITFHRQASVDVACVVPGGGISAATRR